MQNACLYDNDFTGGITTQAKANDERGNRQASSSEQSGDLF